MRECLVSSIITGRVMFVGPFTIFDLIYFPCTQSRIATTKAQLSNQSSRTCKVNYHGKKREGIVLPPSPRFES